jgi:hypothetical protein
MEKLRIDVHFFCLRDLAELEPADMTEFHLEWIVGPFIEDVLPMFKRWRQLRRLTVCRGLCEIKIYGARRETSVLPFEILSDFVMGMKHLSHLRIVTDCESYDQLEILRDKVKKLILPLRPNLKCDINRWEWR